MKKTGITFLLLVLTLNAFSQKRKNSDYVLWSSENKLSENDFTPKKADSIGSSCNAIFLLDYHKSFLKMSYNKMIRNAMLKSSSWIDTTKDITAQIKYLQTLFDIQEIYARQWRKKIMERFPITVNFLSTSQAEATAGAIRRQESYKYEISNANNSTFTNIQTRWEDAIKSELQDLRDYSYEKKNY